MLGGLGALVVLGVRVRVAARVRPDPDGDRLDHDHVPRAVGRDGVHHVSMIVEFLVALIGLGVAIDYSLLVVVRWREERAHGLEGDEAVVRAMETAGRAVVFSGTTVAIGLLAMIVLPLPFLRSIGYAGMLIPLDQRDRRLTLLPVVLLKVGNRLDWPHVRTRRPGEPLVDARGRSLVVRRRWVAAAAAALVLVALVFAATSLQPGTANVNTLSKKGDAHTGLVALERSRDRSGRARADRGPDRRRADPRAGRDARSPASAASTARSPPAARSGSAPAPRSST